MFGPCFDEPSLDDAGEYTNRHAFGQALNCGYLAYRQNITRDAIPYKNKDMRRGWVLGWDEAAKWCKSAR
jgi:ribosome modulation factor